MKIIIKEVVILFMPFLIIIFKAYHYQSQPVIIIFIITKVWLGIHSLFCFFVILEIICDLVTQTAEVTQMIAGGSSPESDSVKPSAAR